MRRATAASSSASRAAHHLRPVTRVAPRLPNPVSVGRGGRNLSWPYLALTLMALPEVQQRGSVMGPAPVRAFHASGGSVLSCKLGGWVCPLPPRPHGLDFGYAPSRGSRQRGWEGPCPSEGHACMLRPVCWGGSVLSCMLWGVCPLPPRPHGHMAPSPPWSSGGNV